MQTSRGNGDSRDGNALAMMYQKFAIKKCRAAGSTGKREKRRSIGRQTLCHSLFPLHFQN